jgi:CelD/BcsL family acetyltransferase involved in cellulose biosynthesis
MTVGEPQVLTDLAVVEAMLPEWRALADRAAGSALQSPDWLLPLARRYLRGEEPRVLAWREGGELVGIAPLGMSRTRPRLRPLGQLNFWGTTGPLMRGLVDVVASEAARPAVLDSFCDWLAGTADWDVLRLRPAVGSTTPVRVAAESRKVGWTYAPYRSLRSTTYQLTLPEAAEGWQAHLSGRTRKGMRWEMRKFAEFRGGRIEHVTEADDLAAALDAVERLLGARWGEQEIYFRLDPRFRDHIGETIPRMVALGSAWVTVARDEAGVCGCLVSTAQNGHAMALLLASTTAPEYRPFSLGKHLFDAGIGEAVRRGCRDYDFLWVGAYKEDFWHAEARALETAVVGRGLVGRPLARLLAWRDERRSRMVGARLATG